MSLVTSLLLQRPSASSTSSGARTVTFTVGLGGVPTIGATVRMSRGVESFALSTDAAGEATFHVDDGQWNYVVTKTGALPQSGVLNVASDLEENVMLELIPAGGLSPTPGMVRLTLNVSSNGVPLPNAKIALQIVKGSDEKMITVGKSFDTGAPISVTSNEFGQAFVDVLPSAKWARLASGEPRPWRATCQKPFIVKEFIVTEAGNVFDLASSNE